MNADIILAFKAGMDYERGGAISRDTRRKPERRERALIREASELLAIDPETGALRAHYMLLGYAEAAR